MKIYKIVTPHSGKCYVGRTIKTLNARFSVHRSAYNRWWVMKGYWCSSFGLLWLGDCSIELIEETEDDQAERKWIAQLDCVNNRRMYPSRHILYVANRESILAQQKKRVACDRCGTETSRGNKRRHQRTKKCQTIYAAKCEK